MQIQWCNKEIAELIRNQPIKWVIGLQEGRAVIWVSLWRLIK